MPVAVANPPETPGRPSLSGDGLLMVFFADQLVSGLRLATRSIVTEEFAKERVLSFRRVPSGHVNPARSATTAEMLYSGTSDAGSLGSSCRRGWATTFFRAHPSWG